MAAVCLLDPGLHDHALLLTGHLEIAHGDGLDRGGDGDRDDGLGKADKARKLLFSSLGS